MPQPEIRVLVTEEECLEYQTFAAGIAKTLGYNCDRPKTLWRYTTADGLFGILESASIYATQLSCLNDVSELRYAMHMVQNAMRMLRARTPGDDPDRDYIFDLIDRVAGVDTVPTSDLYVACFSGKEDDLSQWRAYGNGENGYALAFQTQFLLSQHSIVLSTASSPRSPTTTSCILRWPGKSPRLSSISSYAA